MNIVVPDSEMGIFNPVWSAQIWCFSKDCKILGGGGGGGVVFIHLPILIPVWD